MGYATIWKPHGDEEDTVKPTFGELFQVDDVIWAPIHGLCGKSTYVEDTSALCVAKDIVDAEHVGLRVRHIHIP
jgi:hypothetical protein